MWEAICALSGTDSDGYVFSGELTEETVELCREERRVVVGKTSDNPKRMRYSRKTTVDQILSPSRGGWD